jgi:hypothetical protein
MANVCLKTEKSCGRNYGDESNLVASSFKVILAQTFGDGESIDREIVSPRSFDFLAQFGGGGRIEFLRRGAHMGGAQGPTGIASARIVANGLSQRGNGFFELLVNGWI